MLEGAYYLNAGNLLPKIEDIKLLTETEGCSDHCDGDMA